jgi:hypothetical protein
VSASDEPVAVRPDIRTWAEELARAAIAAPARAAASLPSLDRAPVQRRAVAAMLFRLARRADEALSASLAHAGQAWEQVDAPSIVDVDFERDNTALRRRLGAAAQPAAPPSERAVALEGLLVLDVAVALARLVERRMASLLRLRLRTPGRELMPGGRPFLDLGAALHEAAEAWR